MDGNLSAFAAYSVMNGTSAAAKKGKPKKKANKNSVPPIKLTISKKNLPKPASKTLKNKKNLIANLDEATQNGLVEPIPSASNGTTEAKKKRKSKTISKTTQEVPQEPSTSQVNASASTSAQAEASITREVTVNTLLSESGASALEQTNHASIVDQPDVVAGNLHLEDSMSLAKQTFAWLIEPTTVEDFMENCWEKRTLHIKRTSPEKYKNLLSTAMIDEKLLKENIEYTKNIDVTSYRDGERETHNLEGRAMPYAVWASYHEGCSIRMLNPQTFFPPIHQLNATLQEHFRCMAGANFYLTPPNSQGFAPHYDDIEAFVLQIEGKKRWKLYAAPTEDEKLARASSANLKQDEIGEPIMEVTLQPGDLLYFPRGTVHQAQTVPGCHSLHITLSFYQKMSFGDLLEGLTTQALENAINTDIEYRRGVPLDIWDHLGLVYSDNESDKRTIIKEHLKGLIHKLVDHADFDDAVDQMALRYQHDALPPFLNKHELPRTCYGTKAKITPNGKVQLNKFRPDTKFRLLRANCVRLVCHEVGVFRLFYYVDNSKEYHASDMNYTELEGDAAVDVEYIIRSYPRFIDTMELTCNGRSVKESLNVVQELWNRGFLMTLNPIN